MPTLLEETEVRIELTDVLKRVPLNRLTKNGYLLVAPRGKGVHLSGVLKYCAVSAKILKPGEPLEEELPWRMALGLAVEEFLASLYPDMIWQPGEQLEDGIFMNPDGISPYSSRYTDYVDYLLVEEFKCTWKKRKPGEQILREWLWNQQMRAECRVFSTQWARLHVFYVNGDYRPSAPCCVRYLIQYSQSDVDSTWAMLQKNKHKAVPER